MPNYYNAYNNPWSGGFNAWGQPVAQPPMMNYGMSGVQQNPQYMVQVDGEMAARAWAMPNNLPPKTVIPLWDYDGVHVYFKSTDEYGRVNPMRKGRIVFDDEQAALPPVQQVSGEAAPIQAEQFVTKEDLATMKAELANELKNMLNEQKPSGNQNGSNNRGGNR